jgi:hypothetical protein
MKSIKIFIFALLLTAVSALDISAQQKDSLGNYDGKGLSPADYLRIFGPISGKKFNKITGDFREIKDIIISGNKITTKLYNYGSVCAPGVEPDIEDLVWNGLGYGFEFGTLAGAEVMGKDGKLLHIISDSHVNRNYGDYNPKGDIKWGWLPRAGYSDPDQNRIASLNAADVNGDGKPDSWPENWYSAGAGRYIWPAFLGDMATAPDEEVFYAIDDYTNYEFIDKYQPFNNDATKGGLGLDADVRIMQFNNPLAEDLIFMVYQITNASDQDITKAYFGMYGDPHVGGANDYKDDMSVFIAPKNPGYKQRERSMVYSYDYDKKGHGGKQPGYFGWKFLESPSKDNDNGDNDDDGIVDETPFNDKGVYIDGVNLPLTTGILPENVAKYTDVYGAPKARWSGDEDGDWNPERDDSGIDGIDENSASYPGPDYGEGDGRPSQAWYFDANSNGEMDNEEMASLTDEILPGYKWAGSEPNFGYRDVSESDQVGLTGFTVVLADELASRPKEDEKIWEYFNKPNIDNNQPLLSSPGDNAFIFSTGSLSLKRGESQRFSMVIVMGQNENDLLLNAETSVRILEADYRFAQPPQKPLVRAVAGDGKVTLYWDSKSEKSIDPFSGGEDFEGYKIYRSRDFKFSDVYTITDVNGVPFLGRALEDTYTGRQAQFDLDNEYSGLSASEYYGRGVKYYLGDNTGLVHEYVDSTVTNGITYYYAVVAYDRGTDLLPPSETQAVIQQDPITAELSFDVNTMAVTPGPMGIGIKNADLGLSSNNLNHVAGNSTSFAYAKILDDLAIKKKTYKLTFADTLYYSLMDSTGIKETFISKDTIMVTLQNTHLIPASIIVYDQNNNVVDKSYYYVNENSGQIKGTGYNTLPKGEMFSIYYKYYPVYRSSLINMEDGNPAVDGFRIYMRNDTLGLSSSSDFESSEVLSIKDSIAFKPASDKIALRADWEFRWNDADTLPGKKWAHPDSVFTNNRWIKIPFQIINTITGNKVSFNLREPILKTRNNGQWDWGEFMDLYPDNTDTVKSYTVMFKVDTTIKPFRMPKAGDIYHLRTTKPFNENDVYIIEPNEIQFENTTAQNSINNIYVVPNPYVAYSDFENPGRTLTKRGDRQLQFRNLPPKCTIRIYTITGELVDQIEKDDNASIASWNLLSSEGMRIAYGVYLYHVDIPGAGEKIGRFAVIK